MAQLRPCSDSLLMEYSKWHIDTLFRISSTAKIRIAVLPLPEGAILLFNSALAASSDAPNVLYNVKPAVNLDTITLT